MEGLNIKTGSVKSSIFIGYSEDGGEVIRIDGDGRIFWNKREVETDDELRAAMMELKSVFVKNK
ncbi:MAG: hypothetical protein K2P74_04500 [Nitrosomonas sp.]|nr:hypothetical protein [Nitrosomonas sp.]